MKSRLNLLEFIMRLKDLSYETLKEVEQTETNEDKLKLIKLEISRRIYASG